MFDVINHVDTLGQDSSTEKMYRFIRINISNWQKLTSD